jgi:imidazolonepropionase-like amidohydrolase
MRLALIALVACSGGKKAEPPVTALAGDLVFTNVTVVPMDRDTTLAKQNVIVRGDKIVAIAPKVDVGPATKIDGTGKWLMPGLADMHVHTWSDDDLTMFVAAGVTTVRNMFGGEQFLVWRKDIAAGKRFGPTLVTATPIIDGDPPVWPGSIVMTKPDEVDGKVAALKAQGYDFLKPYSNLEKPVYDALVAAGKKHGITLQGHVPRAVGLEQVIASGQKSVEHLDGWLAMLAPTAERSPVSYWKTIANRVAKVELTRIPAVADSMKKAGVWNCPTLIVMQRMAALDDVPALEKKVQWLQYVPASIQAMWNPKADFRVQKMAPEDFVTMRATNQISDKIVKVLATSGAPMLVGTDTGNPYVVAGAALHDEIELLIAAGASRPRVMRAATADAATFLAQQGTAGVVAVGARADLLLVSVDPMTTPLPLIPDGVVLRGTWLPKSELEAKLALIGKTKVTDRFKDMPALTPEGKDVKQAHYEIQTADGVAGEERVAVGVVDGKRVIVSQMVNDMPGHIETTYRIAGLTTKVEQKTAFGSTAIEAKANGKKLVGTGTASGQKVDLSADIPTGAFISGPGIGAVIELLATITLKPKEKGKAFSLVISTFPRATLEKADYEIERADDVDGKQKYVVMVTFGNMHISLDLLVDNGIPIEATFGQPLGFKYVRK